MSTDTGRSVLRGATTHAQPKRLARPRRAAAEVGVAEMAVATIDAGYQAGLAAGHEAGIRQGLVDAQPRVAEAVAAARAEFERTANQRLREFEAEIGTRLGRIDRLLAGLDAALAKRLDELERDAVELAYAAVCKVVGEQAGQGEAVARFVRHGIEALRGAPLLSVRLHEADLRALQAHPQGREVMAGAPQLRWLADAAVPAGGCLFETPSGTLDARLDTQLAALRAAWDAAAVASRGAA